jgi:MYXO-CTERM domain-containing protein
MGKKARLGWFSGLACAAVVTLGASTAGAATTQENFAKYTKLRQRLATDFMVVGDGPGYSQPAEARNDGQGFIKWADSTINLGFYMSVLATEYHLKSNASIYPGADNKEANAAQKTLDELYYALYAMERLDRVADKAFPEPCGQSEALNGFFLRDDVPEGFHQKFPPLTSTQSDFIDPAITNKEMSQDQVYHVLMGLALVKHLVPATVVVKGKTLKTWAAEQAKRIGQHFAKGNWVIKNPACGNRDVARGEQGIGYSAGTKHVFSFISDGTYTPSTPIDLWGTLKNPSNPAYNDADNLHMAMSIAAVGNGWGATTAQDLATLSGKQDWVLYPILHRVLHGAAADAFCKTTGTALNKRAREMLDELPSNGEPSNPRPGPPAVHGFTVSNRFIRSKDQHYVGQLGGDGTRYSGNDYMLLHNLYAIATPATWTQGPSAAPCSSPASVDPGSSGSTGQNPGGGNSSGGQSSGGTDGSSGDLGPGGSSDGGDASGCGCRVATPSTKTGVAALASIAALLLVARRRRR